MQPRSLMLMFFQMAGWTQYLSASQKIASESSFAIPA
jgi:hypothetical protein